MYAFMALCVINVQPLLINYLYKNIRIDIQYIELMKNLLLYRFECDFLFALFNEKIIK